MPLPHAAWRCLALPPESLATKGNGGLGVIFGTVFRNGLQDWSEQRRKVLWRDSKGGN